MNEPVGGLTDKIFDAYLASKITPDAMTRLVRQVRTVLDGVSDEAAGAVLSRMLVTWLLG